MLELFLVITLIALLFALLALFGLLRAGKKPGPEEPVKSFPNKRSLSGQMDKCK
jgi:hypothetical protein